MPARYSFQKVNRRVRPARRLNSEQPHCSRMFSRSNRAISSSKFNTQLEERRRTYAAHHNSTAQRSQNSVSNATNPHDNTSTMIDDAENIGAAGTYESTTSLPLSSNWTYTNSYMVKFETRETQAMKTQTAAAQGQEQPCIILECLEPVSCRHETILW